MNITALFPVIFALLPPFSGFRLHNSQWKVGIFPRDRLHRLDVGARGTTLVQLITPPPNLTGDLHIGNALNIVCSDIFLRYSELNQRLVYARFGSDHAGHGLERIINHQLGPDSSVADRIDGALKYCEQVKAGHIDTLGSLGVDWRYQGWTLDPHSKDVTREAFVNLYNQGYISEKLYPTFAKITQEGATFLDVADVELVNKKVELFSIELPLVEGGALPSGYGDTDSITSSSEKGGATTPLHTSPTSITAYTTEPGLLHATAAIAVPVEDYERYRGMVAVLPTSKRNVPLVPQSGLEESNPVLLLPGYSQNHFQLAWDNGLEIINITDQYGKLQNVPQNLQGLDLDQARDALRDLFTLVSQVDTKVPQLLGDASSKVFVQPAPHWMLDVTAISHTALASLDLLKVDPSSRVSMLRQRLETKQPWCISRNGWWGLRVPVWHLCKNGYRKSIAAKSESEARELASVHLGRSIEEAFKDGYTLEQDTRTLDTWFISALWPIYTRPDLDILGIDSTKIQYGDLLETKLLNEAEDTVSGVGYLPSNGSGESGVDMAPKNDFPNNTDFPLEDNTKNQLGFSRGVNSTGVDDTTHITRVLYTGYDILHSWVARMLLLCTNVSNGKLPFDRVVLHGIVNDNKGRKMSKSWGNTITASEFVKTFGHLNGFPDLSKPSEIALMMESIWGTPKYHDPLSVAQARMTLAAAASKANACHDVDAYRARVQSVLKKVAQITNYVSQVCKKRGLENIMDLEEPDSEDFVPGAINAAFARRGRELGNLIEAFEFRRAFETLEQCVSVFSTYMIPAHRQEYCNDATMVQAYQQLLTLFMPFAPQLIMAMPLPLNLATDGNLFQWPNFGPVDTKAESAFDAIENVVRQLRRHALDGETTAVVVAPLEFKAALEKHKPFLEYLLKLTYNTVIDYNIQS
ncbi:valyl-tRNA synthetase [Babesia ovis]|uniref:valine--tRNA ligase n=1 Tax=Babesia ovis TaxID=5869 RepID=A0A9W5WTW5_BABOV|nr:valyl-tRNA synthetase [Babesia ovis]